MPSRGDQAAGLRRLMAGASPRVVTLLAAADYGGQAGLLTNLAAALYHQGGNALIVATQESGTRLDAYGLAGAPTLHEVAGAAVTQAQAVRQATDGYAIARLGRPAGSVPLQALMLELQQQYGCLLVDAALDEAHALPFALRPQHDIVIRMQCDADSITGAYRLIKQLYVQLGRRPFGILLTETGDQEAQAVFGNLAEVARRYLQLELDFVGVIPADEYFARAARLGRAVIDAFPMAAASRAFKALASRLAAAQSTPFGDRSMPCTP